MDLQALLPQLVRRAIAWAETISAEAATTGDTLSDAGLVITRLVGVQFPEQIRIVVVNQLPIPTDHELQVATLQTGLLCPTMTGLTLGYSIIICQGHLSRRLLSHECRHAYQYETAGGIAMFLPAYLNSIVQVGYWNSPFEQDARAHEVADGYVTNDLLVM